MAGQKFQTVRGMYDLTPDLARRYDSLLSAFTKTVEDAGFGRIETPIVESAGLFSRSVGDETDVVSKEMYAFEDRGGDEIALRPESTAGVVRAYLEHGMGSLPQPVRLWYAGPMFRYDRPQAGRQRQFNQFGTEIIGDAAPSIDAQTITLALRFFKKIGLTGISLQINTIGDAQCRPKYRKALVSYLSEHKDRLSEEDQARLSKNPLRVLDSKDPGARDVAEGAPQILNYLCEACQAHFSGVLEYLDDLGVSYELNQQLVRGLDYYTRTVFEFYGEREGAQASLGGGGRYDGLAELLGGQPTPAIGFALGVERLMLELAAQEVPAPAEPRRVYIASLGEPARLAAFRLIERLLDSGIGALGAVERDGIGAQLSKANQLGVPYAVIIGQKEVKEGTVLLRDMQTGAQEAVALDAVPGEVKRRLGE